MTMIPAPVRPPYAQAPTAALRRTRPGGGGARRGPRTRALAAVAVAALLAGCGNEAELPLLTNAAPVAVGDVHQWFPIEPDDRLTYFEIVEPTVLDTAERRVGNVIYQRTVYANNTAVPGENYLQATIVFHPGGILHQLPSDTSDLIQRSVGYGPDELEAKLTREFPGTVAVATGDVPTNVYGYFNYAVARYGSDVTCSYAYQVIGDRSRVLPSDYLGILLEMRLCRALSNGEPDPVETNLNLFEDLRFRDKTGILPRNQLWEGSEPPSVFTYDPEKLGTGQPHTPAGTTEFTGTAPKIALDNYD